MIASYEYDGALRPTRREFKAGETVLSSWSGITYDETDNRTAKNVFQRRPDSLGSPDSGVGTYTHDGLSRLVKFRHPLDPALSPVVVLDLDDASNVTAESGTTSSYVNNRLATRTVPDVGVYSYLHDRFGNQTTESQTDPAYPTGVTT